ncbi:hypothetical protein DL770_007394 [Monosporascus sp. CRB-9-2]|nr:hypothetical protein DL770_007394 [Monosporascus sp. CRB-9-2]
MTDRPERQTRGRSSRARPRRPSARRQERWEPQEEHRRYRDSSVRSTRVGWYEGHEASSHYQGDDYERSGYHYQGEEYERRGHRYEGDDYERGGHRYEGDDYERGGHRHRDDDYHYGYRGTRRYEDDRDGHLVQIHVNAVPERGSRRWPSPPRYRDPYEDDYAWRERSSPRWRSPPRYRGRLEDDSARGDGYGYARGGRGYRGRSPIRPRSPSPVRPRALPPVPSRAPSLARPRAPPRAPPPAPAPPRAPQPRVSGNGVWLTPKPKPPNVRPLPRDRNLIHCENCNRQHDPRLCRGPVSNGRINVCPRCGSKRHIFEECWFGDPDVDDLDDFLWHPRQGLAPIATRIDLSDRQAKPGRHVRPVYSRKFAQEQYTLEKTEKMRLGLPYLEKTIDYRSLQPPEFECMNTPLDPSLVGYTRGPPASRNPRPRHAQASVEKDANELMPIPPGVEMDPNEPMPIPPGVEMDPNELMPIPPWVEESGNADDWTWSPAYWQLHIECKHCWEAAYESSWESQEPGYGHKPECPIAADLPPNPFKHPDHVRAVLGEQ